MPLLSLLAFGLLCWFSTTATAAVAGPSPQPSRIWSGLVLATNPAHPSQVPEGLRKYAEKLKNIFGYNQFELVGESSEKMDDPGERWLIPSKDFCLSVKQRSQPGGNYEIALFQNRRRLAAFETHLNPRSPLFIRGPLYAGGQLVIVLHVLDPAEPPVREMRTPLLAANPSPVSKATPAKEKDRPNSAAASAVALPRQGFNPLPVDRFNPASGDRFGPIPGERPGEFDSRMGKP
jgi:hypothetical protein